MNSSPFKQSVSAAEREAALRRAEFSLSEFMKLRARGALCREATEQLATEAASAFLAHFQDHGAYLARPAGYLSSAGRAAQRFL